MAVTVRVSPRAVTRLRAGSAAAGDQPPADDQTADLLRLVDRLGGRLRPRHPGVADASLARWYVLDGPADRPAAEAVAAALTGHPAVEAAFVAPPAEPAPGPPG